MVARSLAQAVRNVVVLRQQCRGFAHAGNHRLKNAHLRIEGRLLRHVTDTNARLHPDLAVVQPALASARSHRREPRRFAGTVAADQRHPFARVELEIGVIEKRHVAVGQAGVVEFEIRHDRAMKNGARRAPRLR